MKIRCPLYLPRDPRARILIFFVVSFCLLGLLTYLLPLCWPFFANAGVPPAAWAILAAGSTFLIALFGAQAWLRRVDNHNLLRAQERIQYKDAVVIGTAFVIVLFLGFILTATVCAEVVVRSGPPAAGEAGRQAWRIYLPLVWAMAGTATGGIFGFLFGLPKPRDGTSPTNLSQMPTHWIHTGLDDIIDWLTKGITTVALVKTEAILRKFPIWADELAKGITLNSTSTPEARAFAEATLAFYPIVGLVGTYLVTRTYLTGALTRADQTTLGAFSRVELRYADILILQRNLRALNYRGDALSAEAARVARKLASLSLKDLELPIEFALWAKAKSFAKAHDEALEGYEKAITLCPDHPELLLEYAVALQVAECKTESDRRIEEAYRAISPATDADVVKQIYKSLTYVSLYQPAPGGFDRAIRLFTEYENRSGKKDSGGIYVNAACAYGQKYRHLAIQAGWRPGAKPLDLPTNPTEEMQGVRTAALDAIRKAILLDPQWITLLRRQLLSGFTIAGKPKSADEDDLEIFERDPQFQEILGSQEESGKAGGNNLDQTAENAPRPSGDSEAAK
jgi:tetratricopeptide (TPR) repeat protein